VNSFFFYCLFLYFLLRIFLCLFFSFYCLGKVFLYELLSLGIIFISPRIKTQLNIVQNSCWGFFLLMPFLYLLFSFQILRRFIWTTSWCVISQFFTIMTPELLGLCFLLFWFYLTMVLMWLFLQIFYYLMAFS